MSEQPNIELGSFVGRHLLYGAAVSGRKVKLHEWSDNEEDIETLLFDLDGVTYEAQEDPSDGYRSEMRGIFPVSPLELHNRFSPVEVVGSIRTRGEYGGEDEVLELRVVATGKMVLMVGTENIDDYYPSFCAHFDPMALEANQ